MNQYHYYLDLSVRLAKARNKNYLAEFLTEQRNVLDRCFGGEDYVLATYYIPNELFVPFDLPVIYSDRIAGFGAACNLLKEEEWKKSDQYTSRCSYQIYLNSMLKKKILPLPKLIVASNYPCNSAYQFCKELSETYQIPFLDLKVKRQESTEAYQDHVKQMEQIFQYLKDHFSVKKSIQSVVNISNQMILIKKEIDDIRNQYLGIIDTQDMLNIFTLYNDFGKESSVEALQMLRDDLHSKTENYSWKPGVKKLMWLGTTPLCMSLIDKIEEQYACKFVCEDLFLFCAKEIHFDTFCQDLVKRIMDSIFFTEEKRVFKTIEIAKRYQVDGIVHYSQRICKFLPPMFPKIQKAFSDIRIPAIELCGDGIERASWDKNYKEQIETMMRILCEDKKIEC